MARDFSGASPDYMNVGDVAAIDITGTALSVHCWVKLDAFTTGGGWALCKVGNSFNPVQYGLLVGATGLVTFIVGNGSTSHDDCASGAVMSTGIWTPIGGVKNGTGAGASSVFRSNVKSSITSNLSIGNTVQPLTFGRYSDAFANMMNGKLAEVAIWNVALTDNEMAALSIGVSPLMIRRNALKGFWPLYGTGSGEADLSGNVNTAGIGGSVPAADHAPVGRLLNQPG